MVNCSVKQCVYMVGMSKKVQIHKWGLFFLFNEEAGDTALDSWLPFWFHIIMVEVGKATSLCPAPPQTAECAWQHRRCWGSDSCDVALHCAWTSSFWLCFEDLSRVHTLLWPLFVLSCSLFRFQWSKFTCKSPVHLHGQAETASVRGAVSHHKRSCFPVLH